VDEELEEEGGKQVERYSNSEVKTRLRRSWGCMICRNAISYINDIYNCPDYFLLPLFLLAYSKWVVLSIGLV
jgi:hypothetical protein